MSPSTHQPQCPHIPLSTSQRRSKPKQSRKYEIPPSTLQINKLAVHINSSLYHCGPLLELVLLNPRCTLDGKLVFVFHEAIDIDVMGRGIYSDRTNAIPRSLHCASPAAIVPPRPLATIAT
jgi:hypothetical protein